MLTWPCDHPDCNQRSMSVIGNRCPMCGLHLCVTHNSLPRHTCSELDTEARMKLVRASDVPSVASSMRDGMKCRMEIPGDMDDYLDGGQNVHFPINFEDGVKWVVRINLLENRPPLDGYNRSISDSEMETMGILIDHGFGGGSLDYFFMDLGIGEQLYAPIDPEKYPEDKIDRMVLDLANFFIRLSTFTFDSISSLQPARTPALGSKHEPRATMTYIVGPLVDWFISEEAPPYFIGPFKSNRERYLATIDFVLRKIENGVLSPDDPIGVYLWHLEMMEIINKYAKWGEEDNGPYYLKHGDDKGDHILIDEEGNITGILDWEFAYTTTKAEAFISPRGLVTHAEREAGNNLSQLEIKLIKTYEELARPDLADCVRGSRFCYRLQMNMGCLPELSDINLLRQIVGSEKYGYNPLDEWEEGMREKYKENNGFRVLLGKLPFC
ncbi:hypothetical protein IAT40_005753 [Kwoniella sp. CBS 6097]